MFLLCGLAHIKKQNICIVNTNAHLYFLKYYLYVYSQTRLMMHKQSGTCVDFVNVTVIFSLSKHCVIDGIFLCIIPEYEYSYYRDSWTYRFQGIGRFLTRTAVGEIHHGDRATTDGNIQAQGMYTSYN